MNKFSYSIVGCQIVEWEYKGARKDDKITRNLNKRNSLQNSGGCKYIALPYCICKIWVSEITWLPSKKAKVAE